MQPQRSLHNGLPQPLQLRIQAPTTTFNQGQVSIPPHFSQSPIQAVPIHVIGGQQQALIAKPVNMSPIQFGRINTAERVHRSRSAPNVSFGAQPSLPVMQVPKQSLPPPPPVLAAQSQDIIPDLETPPRSKAKRKRKLKTPRISRPHLTPAEKLAYTNLIAQYITYARIFICEVQRVAHVGRT